MRTFGDILTILCFSTIFAIFFRILVLNAYYFPRQKLFQNCIKNNMQHKIISQFFLLRGHHFLLFFATMGFAPSKRECEHSMVCVHSAFFAAMSSFSCCLVPPSCALREFLAETWQETWGDRTTHVCSTPWDNRAESSL